MGEWWYEMIGCVQIHRNFKGQNSKNRRKLNSGAENKETRARGECTAVRQAPWAAHGGLWLIRSRHFSNAAFWCTFLSAGFVLDRLNWGYWASFATPFDLLGRQLHSFSYYLAHHT